MKTTKQLLERIEELESQLVTLQLTASIAMEPKNQSLKTYNHLTKQVLKTLTPSASCNPVVAMEFQVEREIWESALAAGERALQGLAAEPEPIPMLICPACKDPTPGLIDGLCLSCDELFNMHMACGFQPNGVLQMPKKVRTQ